MAKGQRMPKAVQNLLDTREAKLRRLLDQTSSDKTSSKHEKGIHHTTNSARNVKKREQSNSSHSSMNAGKTNKIRKIGRMQLIMDSAKTTNSGYRRYDNYATAAIMTSARV